MAVDAGLVFHISHFTFHVSLKLAQNGSVDRKKRASQPIIWASLMTPLSLYSMRASATFAELMLFAALMK